MSAEAESAVNLMGTRVSVAAGFDPAVIVAIITAIIQVISGCKKPANKAEAGSLIADVGENHPDRCPLWLRGCFRQHGVKGPAQINDLWGELVADATTHPEAAMALAA